MRPSTTRVGRRSLRVRTAAAAVVGLAALAAACGGSPPPTTTTTSTTATAPVVTVSPRLAAVISCFERQGVSVPVDATAGVLRRLFGALPLARQHAVFTACSATLSRKLRAKIEALMATEVTPASSTTSTA